MLKKIYISGLLFFFCFSGVKAQNIQLKNRDEYLHNTPDIEMVYIVGSSFTMGSPSDEADREIDEDLHKITVSSFYMSKYEITQKQYKDVMGENPSYFNNCGDDCPVENITWYNAIEFCNKLSRKEGLSPYYYIDTTQQDTNNKNKYDDLKLLITIKSDSKGYRLPTEAEWEYACRAGTTTPFYTGSCLSADDANYNANYPYNHCSKGTYRAKTLPVGSLSKNSFGLYDMHGNVYEWCYDWYDSNYYKNTPENNPKGNNTGGYRVLRGGSWYNAAQDCRSADRSDSTPDFGNGDIGFRLVRD